MSRLTERERQVLQLVAGGASNKQIAKGLGLKVPTVKNHLFHVSRKYGTSGKLMTVMWGIRVGDVDLATALKDVDTWKGCDI